MNENKSPTRNVYVSPKRVKKFLSAVMDIPEAHVDLAMQIFKDLTIGIVRINDKDFIEKEAKKFGNQSRANKGRRALNKMKIITKKYEGKDLNKPIYTVNRTADVMPHIQKQTQAVLTALRSLLLNGNKWPEYKYNEKDIDNRTYQADRMRELKAKKR